MTKRVEIEGRRYDQRVITAITGKGTADKLKKWEKLLADIVSDSKQLPLRLNEVVSLKKTKDLRLALVRLQIMADLYMSDDMDFYQGWTYVGETVERLIYGSLALDKGFEEKKPKKKKKDEKKEESK
jgi:hypothetical protein